MKGIFIGSFNPPTIAHFEIANLLTKKVDKIIFVPVNSLEKELIDFHKRCVMLSYFRKYHVPFQICDLMKNYSYLNYRIIDLLKKKYGDIVIIIGSDLLIQLDKFEHYEELLKTYSFIVITRDKMDVKKIIQNKYLDYKKQFKIIYYDNNISSSLARKLLKENKCMEGILDKDVYEYIKKEHLYV